MAVRSKDRGKRSRPEAGAEVSKPDKNHNPWLGQGSKVRGQRPGAPCSDTAHLSCCSWGQSPYEHRSCRGHRLGFPTSPAGTAGPSWGWIGR